ncbi:uncharacterized protein LOC125670657 [Ostrea edulis]|uniref:uncharacterized protein LOC125670657 n=1 Tax=Ostrea edulis TaxID=37623 RepID=UPI002094B2E8|nr:uncharacterized protein LOC125670657 [Ostrea edulis]XP_048761910.1 uncharacterized protein LOC125670657 [Ostrea edulis]XP_048761911.1 uncharacterized protein LOC125670657 [Ostrea edulis]XP_048761912.1 uncharacterized protein LOC125670657 [Ostrea edulis]XP_056017725.1 uncharacterized protein LOC125670657 [Ostrea edulis]
MYEETANIFDNNNSSSAMDFGSVHNPKRKRIDDICPEQTPETTPVYRKHLIPISRNSRVYSTTDWKDSGTAIFCPVTCDLFLNIHKYDQITTSQGDFFVGDVHGNYEKTTSGNVVHLWKHDKVERQFYIAQSLLFAVPQDFVMMQKILHSM